MIELFYNMVKILETDIQYGKYNLIGEYEIVYDYVLLNE